MYSAGCWIGMTKADYRQVEKRDKDLLYSLLKLARTTPLRAILNELGILTMECVVMREKRREDQSRSPPVARKGLYGRKIGA